MANQELLTEFRIREEFHDVCLSNLTVNKVIQLGIDQRYSLEFIKQINEKDEVIKKCPNDGCDVYAVNGTNGNEIIK